MRPPPDSGSRASCFRGRNLLSGDVKASENPGKRATARPLEDQPMTEHSRVVRQSEEWYATTAGSHALFRERMLIAHMLTSWPRRNQTLLDMGCGAGHFLEMFWNAGFDVTGVDEQEECLALARKKIGHRATLRQSNLERLPFDDDDFDFVTLVTALEHTKDPDAVLREAFRVATHGVLVLFFNSWSLYRFERTGNPVAGKKARPGASGPENTSGVLESFAGPLWLSPFRVFRMILRESGKRPSAFRSTLFRPSWFWRGEDPPRWSLGRTNIFPFGAVAAFRVDLSPLSGTTIKIPARRPIQAIR